MSAGRDDQGRWSALLSEPAAQAQAAGAPLGATEAGELEASLLAPRTRDDPASRRRSAAVSAGTIAGLLVVWQLLPTLGLVNRLLLPTPLDVAGGLWTLLTAGFLWEHFSTTMTEALVGYGIGVALGFGLGTVLAVVPLLRETFSPYLLGLQSLPKVVLAPLLIGALGFGIESKIATAVAICFFPLMVNTMVGLQLAEPASLRLLQSLGASRWQVYRKLRLPTALPLIFVGLKHSLLLAFTGALVAEILVGSASGLGRLVQVYNAQIRMHLAFAVVVIVALIAVGLVLVFDWVDRRVVFWREDDGRERL